MTSSVSLTQRLTCQCQHVTVYIVTCAVFVKNDATHKAGPVYSQFQYIEHKADLVLCILKLAIHRAGEISL